MKKILLTICVLALSTVICSANSHPSLLLTEKGVAEMKQVLGKNELFDRTVANAKAQADKAVAEPIVVPVPKDGAGAYSHEKHKENYYAMYYCGIVYQVTGEQKYAQFVADMLDEYARLYPTLDYHPIKMSSTPGRLFWQTLNDFVWLVHTSVAYDCIYDYLTPEHRERLNKEMFRPMAEFIMDGNPKNFATFNKMHNHGTWATTAVGMIGYVMGDDELVKKSLYGSDLTGKNGGFLQQLHELFSPDGYFTEGAYYQRYAIWPFVVFAQAINNNQPELGIFSYRDGILKKAVNTLLQMAYDGTFFLLNDALPKGYDVQELIFATDIAYAADPSQKQLLDIAERYQNNFLPTDAGYAVARDILAGQAEPFVLKSQLLRDGPDGTRGGTAIFRNPVEGENATVIMKATSHGLSHGHYDKLTISYYDNGSPILVDYGAARFLNIQVKHNGGYTPLNDSYAMSTIAHNTVSVDEKTNYGGDIKVSSKYAPTIYLYDDSDPAIQVASAYEYNAYPDVQMHRTIAYINQIGGRPVILDIFRTRSDGKHQYDLPFYYNGQMISLSTPYTKALGTMTTMGDNNGYQYLWKEASAKATGPFTCFTFLQGDRFYSVTTANGKDTELFFARTGANDPEYFLRSEPCYMVRENNAANHVFLSAVETHGLYDLIIEKTEEATSAVTWLEVLEDEPGHTLVGIEVNGQKAHFRIDYGKTANDKKWSYSIVK